MFKILRPLYLLSIAFGINPIRFLKGLRGVPYFISDFIKLSRQKNTAKIADFRFGSFYPCLDDRFMQSGYVNGHYFAQDLFVAQELFKRNPKKHYDACSRIDGFVAHVATFREIEVFDIRTLENKIRNVNFLQLDLMGELPTNMLEVCESLSSLHAIEHFGLGRYCDPVAYDGHLIGFQNLYKMLKKSGILYFSVPIGPQRIEFNAHRVFSLTYLLQLFAGKFEVESFSYVDDSSKLHPNVVLSPESIAHNFNCYYGCGIFILKKL